MKKSLYKSFFLIAICFLYGCTEPFALQTNTFENILVVEGTITNETKKQEIKLSRTYQLEDNGSKIEKNAIVYILDDIGNRYDFQENNDSYISQTAFQAQPNRNYELHITTADGKSYVSTREKLTTVSPITDVKPEVFINNGLKGVQINVESYDPTNTSRYYRYEYEETYKIIAPKWVSVKAVVIDSQNYQLVPRDYEARICYSNNKSKELFLINTNGQVQDKVNFPIRFIDNKNYIITNRYSILVKQYVESYNSYSYYNTIKKLSSSENILSPIQPGFVIGNIRSTQDNNEKIIGYFSVSSYSEKRIFFNFEDLFPDDEPPPYITSCKTTNDNLFNFCFSPTDTACKGNAFISLIRSNKIAYYDRNLDLITAYDIKCGDCTSFSSNIKPTFWID